MPRQPFRTSQWTVKRGMDFCVASLALLLVSPVIALAAIAVMRETGGGAIFRQRRVGLDGREFDVLKLQTMVPASEGDSATTWNIAKDDRMRPVGRFLRRTSLDELPQLWNVVRGDMSLVGPRPERPHFVEEFQRQYPRYLARHRVPCGFTGYAQIQGVRGDTSIAERIAYENLYIEAWSLWLDVKIVLRTIPAVLRGTGG
jgi:lipopolysaccharide/colanic/teichoic acid biosynthesis glycosyltransferase